MLLVQSLSLSSTLNTVIPTHLGRDLTAAHKAQEVNAQSSSYPRTDAPLLDFEEKQGFISLKLPSQRVTQPVLQPSLTTRWHPVLPPPPPPPPDGRALLHPLRWPCTTQTGPLGQTPRARQPFQLRLPIAWGIRIAQPMRQLGMAYGGKQSLCPCLVTPKLLLCHRTAGRGWMFLVKRCPEKTQGNTVCSRKRAAAPGGAETASRGLQLRVW